MLKLSDYVKKRNGVALGDSKSLKNMIIRSLGAGKFSEFWKYWNPIWSYYLGKYIFKPLKKVFPQAISLILTFTFCGFLHDLAIMILRWNIELHVTTWFFLMSLCVVLGSIAKIDYSKYPWIIRAFINLLFIFGCLLIAYQFRE